MASKAQNQRIMRYCDMQIKRWKRFLSQTKSDGRIEQCKSMILLYERALWTTLADDSGFATLPWVILGIAGYLVYHLVASGFFQALTALGGVR